MFTLQDGREHLYQWDVDRYIIVNDPNICEVHFCNRTSDCSLVVEVKDGLAAIPNIILQDARPIRAYAYCDDKYTLTEQQFAVKARTKPADYVYTETEVKSYEYLDAKLKEIEEQGFSEETVKAAVDGYLEANPVYVPTKVSEFANDANYTDKEYVDAADSELSLEIDNIEYNINNIINPTIQAKADKTYVDKEIAGIDIPTVPTKVSAFENDKGYITEHQDISGKADKEHTHSISEVTDYVAPDLSPYATKQEVKEAVDAIDIPEVDFTGYATETFVNDAVAGIHIPSKVSELENDKGYLTEHQSLDEYYTKGEVDTKITDAVTSGTVDLSNYYTKGETDTAISDAISAIPPTDFSNYYNKTETENIVNEAVGNISIPDVSTKADKEHTHSINDIIDYVAPEIPSLDGYATEQYVNDAIANIPTGGEAPDLSAYATIEYVDDAIANIDIPEGGGVTTFALPHDLLSIATTPNDSGEYETHTASGVLLDFAQAVMANNGQVIATMYVEQYNAYTPVVIMNVDKDNNEFTFTHLIPSQFASENWFTSNVFRMYCVDYNWKYHLYSSPSNSFASSGDVYEAEQRSHIYVDLRGRDIGSNGNAGEIEGAVDARDRYTMYGNHPVITVAATSPSGDDIYSSCSTVQLYNKGIRITAIFLDTNNTLFGRECIIDTDDNEELVYTYNSYSIPTGEGGGSVDLSNYYTKTEVDEKIADVDGGTLSGVLTDNDEGDVTIVLSGEASGGGSGSAIKVVTVNSSSTYSDSDEETAMWEDIYNNENYDDYIVQVTSGYAGRRYTIDTWKVGVGSNYIEAYYNKDATRHYIRVTLKDGVFQSKLNRDRSWDGTPTWQWDGYAPNLTNYNMVRLVARINSDDNQLINIDIFNHSGNQISDSNKYYIPDYYGWLKDSSFSRLYLSLNPVQIRCEASDGSSDYFDSVEFLGFYYWG